MARFLFQFFIEFDGFWSLGGGAPNARKEGGGGATCISAYQILVEIDDLWRAPVLALA
jgi:hypothetical protein